MRTMCAPWPVIVFQLCSVLSILSTLLSPSGYWHPRVKIKVTRKTEMRSFTVTNNNNSWFRSQFRGDFMRSIDQKTWVDPSSDSFSWNMCICGSTPLLHDRFQVSWKSVYLFTELLPITFAKRQQSIIRTQPKIQFSYTHQSEAHISLQEKTLKPFRKCQFGMCKTSAFHSLWSLSGFESCISEISPAMTHPICPTPFSKLAVARKIPTLWLLSETWIM